MRHEPRHGQWPQTLTHTEARTRPGREDHRPVSQSISRVFLSARTLSHCCFTKVGHEPFKVCIYTL